MGQLHKVEPQVSVVSAPVVVTTISKGGLG